MTINLQTGENCQATLRVEIPADVVTSEREDIAKQFLKHARVPGFRPGKAPRKMVEKRFEPGIREELEKRLSSSAFSEVKEKEDLHILSVKSQEATANVDDTYTISAELLVAPTFELPEYSGVPITLPKGEVNDEQLETFIERWKEQNADYTDEPEGTALAMGLFAVVNYKATKDGEEIDTSESPQLKQYLERDNAWILMDEESFLPGFCGELLDHNAGEEISFKLTAPTDFPEESLREQELSFKVTISKVMKKTLPELTDEKVEQTTGGQVKTAEEFRALTSERLTKQMEQYLDGLKSQQALDHLHGLVEFDLPEDMVTQETQNHVNRIFNDSQQRGVDQEALVEQQTDIIEAAGQMGRRDVKTKFIMNEIATKEGLKVSDPEVIQRISAMAASANMSPKKAIRILKDNGQLHNIAEEILFGKALDFVKENASVNVDEAQNAVEAMLEAQKQS